MNNTDKLQQLIENAKKSKSVFQLDQLLDDYLGDDSFKVQTIEEGRMIVQRKFELKSLLTMITTEKYK